MAVEGVAALVLRVSARVRQLRAAGVTSRRIWFRVRREFAAEIAEL